MVVALWWLWYCGVIGCCVAAGELIKYGNVSYQNAVVYEVANPRNLQLKLISETGDADLYVFKSTAFDKANINFSDYQFKSVSFGVDSIAVGKDFEAASMIVVFGVAQTDSRFALEISSVPPADLDYLAIDEAVQRSPGGSYEELCLQHSFDSGAFYAEEEQARLTLLATESSYPAETVTTKRKEGPRKQRSQRSQRQSDEHQQSHRRTSSVMDEDSFLYHFLIWLLEFIVDVFF